jgi:nucleoside-diphosphate-sugar epimerase
LSKKHFLDWLKSYSDGIGCFNVALEHFYGPGDDPTKFVTYLVHSLLRGESALDLTEGLQKRDFIYIDDVIDAFISIINYSFSVGSGFYEYEVGSGAPIEIREFVSLLKKI